MIISIGAAADLGSRLFLAIMSLCVQVKARYIYLAGAALTVIARFGMNGSNSGNNKNELTLQQIN